MKLFRLLMRNSRRQVVLAILAGLVSGAISAGLIALINTALAKGRPLPVVLVWSFVGLCIALPMMRMVSGYLLARLGQKTIFNLRMYLCRRILLAPLRHLEKIGSPHLMALLTDDVLNISNAFTSIPIFSVQLAVAAGCFAYLLWLSWVMFLIVLGLLSMGVAIVQLLGRKASHSMRLAREEQDMLFKHFRSLTEGAKELKLHRDRREEFLSGVIQATAASLEQRNVAGMAIYSAAGSSGQFLFFTLIGTMILVLPAFVQISNELLTQYILTIIYIMMPIDVIFNLLPIMSRANVALKKVDSLGLLLETNSTEDDSLDDLNLQSPWGRLDLMGVTHTYSGERDGNIFTLGPVTLSFNPGETVFIVGGNGSGKSTLAKLISGLYSPESGTIRLGGLPITDKNRECYRQYFSVVFSDFYLFESLLGLHSTELDARAQQYLMRLQLDQKVRVTDGVLSTIDLSQGQRKRLALLTAYLEDRPIYIFDEWAADQDPIFKETFYRLLLPELKNRSKTVIVISHDDRYYYLADRIIKLDYGQVEYDRRVSQSESATAEIPVATSSLS